MENIEIELRKKNIGTFKGHHVDLVYCGLLVRQIYRIRI